MDIDEIRYRFEPAIQEIVDLCQINESFFDRDSFMIYVATVWGNTVAAPERAGVEESDLEVLHEYLNEELEIRLSPDASVSSCYEFIIGKEGDEAMSRLRLTPSHREFLLYFAGLILQH